MNLWIYDYLIIKDLILYQITILNQKFKLLVEVSRKTLYYFY